MAAGTFVPNSDITISANMTHRGGSGDFYTAIDDDPDTGQPDSDAIYVNINTGTEQSDMGLTDTPADFDTMDDLTFRAYLEANGSRSDDNVTVSADIVNSSGVSLIGGAQILYAWTSGTGTPTIGLVTFTINSPTAGDKTTWDGARIRWTWTASKTKGADGIDIDVHAAEIDYNYTVGAANYDETGRAVSVTATVSVASEDYTQNITEAGVVNIVASTAASDTYTGQPNDYDETGRVVNIVATVTATDGAPVPLPYHADFNGTNGDPWPEGWTVFTDSGATTSDADIQSNAGRLIAGTDIDDYVAVQMELDADPRDSEILINLDLSNEQVGTSWLYLQFRGQGDPQASGTVPAGNPLDSYNFAMRTDTGELGNQDQWYVTENGVETAVSGQSPANWHTDTPTSVWIRARVVSASVANAQQFASTYDRVMLQVKKWEGSYHDEPDAWETAYHESSRSQLWGSGRPGLLLTDRAAGSNSDVRVKQFDIQDVQTFEPVLGEAFVADWSTTIPHAEQGIDPLLWRWTEEGTASITRSGGSIRFQTAATSDENATISTRRKFHANTTEVFAEITPEASATTSNKWLYLAQRSSGEFDTGAALRPDYAYYIRFKVDAASNITTDDLFRRDTDASEVNLHDFLTSAQTSRNAGEPFKVRWRIRDEGKNVRHYIKVWDSDATEPSSWLEVLDTTPGNLLGRGGYVYAHARNFNSTETLDVYLDQLEITDTVQYMEFDGPETSGDWGASAKVETPHSADFNPSTDWSMRIRLRMPTAPGPREETNDIDIAVASRYGPDGFGGVNTDEQFVFRHDVYDGRIEQTYRLDSSTEQVRNTFGAGFWDEGAGGQDTVGEGNGYPDVGDTYDLRWDWDRDKGGTQFSQIFSVRKNSKDALISDRDWLRPASGFIYDNAGPQDLYSVTQTLMLLFRTNSTYAHGDLLQILEYLWLGALDNTGTILAHPDFQNDEQTSDDGDTFVDDASTAKTWTRSGTAAWSGATGAATEDVSVAVTATTAATDQQDMDEAGAAVSATATVAGTDAFAASDDLTVAITATVAATDTQAFAYDETGRSVAITASLTAVDTATRLEAPSLSIVATVSGTDQQDQDEALTVSVVGSVSAISAASRSELSRLVAITATTAATDTLNVGGVNYDETGRVVAITATVTGTDAVGYPLEALTVAITASTAQTASVAMVEAGSGGTPVVSLMGTYAHTHDFRSPEVKDLGASALEDGDLSILAMGYGNDDNVSTPLIQSPSYAPFSQVYWTFHGLDAGVSIAARKSDGTDTDNQTLNWNQNGTYSGRYNAGIFLARIQNAATITTVDGDQAADISSITDASSKTPFANMTFSEGDVEIIVVHCQNQRGVSGGAVDDITIPNFTLLGNVNGPETNHNTFLLYRIHTGDVTYNPTLTFSLDSAGTDLATAGRVGYAAAASGLPVDIIATLTGTDTQDGVESLSVAVTASCAATDALTFTEDQSVSVTGTVAATDQQDMIEAPVVAITATTAATDILDSPGSFDETGRVVNVTVTLTATDQQDMIEDASLAVTATVAGTDAFATSDDLVIAVTSTVSATDQADFIENPVVAVTSSVTATDVRNITEAGVTSVTSSVTATDQVDVTEALVVAITSTVIATDAGAEEENRSVAITATVTGTDLLAITEDLAVAITSSVAATDDFTSNAVENLSVSVVATVGATDVASFIDALTVAITATTAATDIYTPDGSSAVENVSVAATAVVTATSAAHWHEAAEAWLDFPFAAIGVTDIKAAQKNALDAQSANLHAGPGMWVTPGGGYGTRIWETTVPGYWGDGTIRKVADGAQTQNRLTIRRLVAGDALDTMPISPGDTVTMTIAVEKVVGHSGNLRFGVEWFDNTDAYLGGSYYNGAWPAAGDVISHESTAAPAGAVHYGLLIYPERDASGDSFRLLGATAKVNDSDTAMYPSLRFREEFSIEARWALNDYNRQAGTGNQYQRPIEFASGSNGWLQYWDYNDPIAYQTIGSYDGSVQHLRNGPRPGRPERMFADGQYVTTKATIDPTTGDWSFARYGQEYYSDTFAETWVPLYVDSTLNFGDQTDGRMGAVSLYHQGLKIPVFDPRYAPDTINDLTVWTDPSAGLEFSANIGAGSITKSEEAGPEVSIVVSVTATDAVDYEQEDAVVAITSTVSMTDLETWIENQTVAILASVSLTELFALTENLTVDVTSFIIATDQGDFIDNLAIDIEAVVVGKDVWFIALPSNPGLGQADTSLENLRGEADSNTGIGRARPGS